MVLITCKDCGEPVSNQARKCPRCGAPTPTENVRGAIALVTFVVIVIAIIADLVMS